MLDQLGRPLEARRYYASALKLAPDEPSVLSNLGLSYALAKDLKHAEETLRSAASRPGADRRVRQNLASLVPACGADIYDGNDLELIRGGEIGRNVALLGDETESDESTLKWTGHASASAVK